MTSRTRTKLKRESAHSAPRAINGLDDWRAFHFWPSLSRRALKRSMQTISMHHCKACRSSVCNPRERRLLEKSTSSLVRQDLRNLTIKLSGNLARFGEDHFSSGYLCKKCFMLVQKRIHLRSELEKIDFNISNLRTSATVFAYDDEHGSCEVVRASKRGNQSLQCNTPKRMRVNDESGASVVVHCIHV